MIQTMYFIAGKLFDERVKVDQFVVRNDHHALAAVVQALRPLEEKSVPGSVLAKRSDPLRTHTHIHTHTMTTHTRAHTLTHAP
jgi:hypothetical protein